MSYEVTTLDNLRINEKGQVLSLLATGLERRRFLDLGVVEDTLIEAVQKSPSGNPTAYLIRGTIIAFRNSDARKVLLKIRW